MAAPLTLADLIRRFDSGEIRLPLMQRDYVWKGRKVVALLDSLYRGWPIGSFYVWHSREDHAVRERVGKNGGVALHDGFHGFLLDGQQRLTSLSLALQGDADGEMSSRAYFDVENEIFVLGGSGMRVRKRIEKGDPLLAPLSELVVVAQGDQEASGIFIERTIRALLEQDRLGEEGELADTYRERMVRVAKMLQRRALCEDFADEDEEHAFELFARLNKGGTSLQAGDVAAARLASTGTRHIVGPMRAMAAEGEMRALGVNFLFLLRAVVTVQRDNCSFAKLPKGWAGDAVSLDKVWQRTERALRFVIHVVREDMGWVHRRWLPSTMALLPLVYLFAKYGAEELTDKELILVRRYLLLTGLRGLFRGSTETTVNSHVAAIRDSHGSRQVRLRALIERIPKYRRVKLKKEELLAPSGAQSPIMQIYLALLHKSGAKSWPSGKVLQDGASDSVVVRYIFPRALASELNLPLERFSAPANCCIVLQQDDRAMSGENPNESWNRMKPSDRVHASAQFYLEAADHLLKPINFADFLEFRAGKLAEHLNRELGLT